MDRHGGPLYRDVPTGLMSGAGLESLFRVEQEFQSVRSFIISVPATLETYLTFNIANIITPFALQLRFK